MATNGWSSVLAAAANACAGEDGCCGCFDDPSKECCMTDRARAVFDLVEAAGGPSLAQCEAIAEGALAVVPVSVLRGVATAGRDAADLCRAADARLST